jgi:hypothetical protein
MWRAGIKLRHFAVIAAGAALLLSGWLLWNREPRYRGVPASSHVLQVIGPTSLPKQSPYDGIQEMGPALAVPALLRVIERQSSPLARWYDVLYSKTPAGIRRPFPVPPARDRILSTALTALARFGAEASPSVPTLIKIYGRSPNQVTSTLGAIGPSASNAIPSLLSGLNPTNSFVGPSKSAASLGSSALCFATATALWKIDPSGDLTAMAFSRNQAGSSLPVAVRTFGLQELSSPPGFYGTSSRWVTLELLGCVRSEAGQVAPTVVKFLHDENERIRAKAAETLGRLGPVVQEYAKEIRPLLLDDWRMVREAATNALIAIESKRPELETRK